MKGKIHLIYKNIINIYGYNCQKNRNHIQLWSEVSTIINSLMLETILDNVAFIGDAAFEPRSSFQKHAWLPKHKQMCIYHQGRRIPNRPASP